MSWVDSSGNVYITSGNVSIGAQVYDEALNVQGNIRAKSTGHADLIADAAAGNNAGLIFRRDGTVRWAMQSVDGDVLYLTRFGGFGYARALTIDNASGYVGIDNPSPAAKLDVNGDIKASGVVAVGDGGASAPSLTFVSDPDTGLYRSGANELRIATGGAARLTVDANGKVSIAAPSSGVALEVAGNVQAKSSSGGAEVGVDAAGNANASLTLYHGGQPRWSLQSVEANRFLISRFNSSGQLLGRVFTILNDSGKVGVGLGNGVDPTEMLDVDGNAKVSGALTAGSFNLAGGLAINPSSVPQGGHLMDAKVNGDSKAYLATAGADKKGEFVIEGDDSGNEGGQLKLNGAGSNYYVYIDNYAGRFRVVTWNGSVEAERLRVPTSGDVIIYGGGLKFGDSRQAINSDGYALYA